MPLESIKVTSIDSQANPYQFEVFVEVKKIPMVWTLKAHTEVGQHCLMQTAQILLWLFSSRYDLAG